MSTLRFGKWEGTGNDFIVVDDRTATFPGGDLALVRRLCDRHFGIGSDGLILLQAPRVEGTAYHMEFFNPDASRSFCGNGSRCAYSFWSDLESDAPARFTAIDGEHRAAWGHGLVMIGMRDVSGVERIDESTDLIHTGSPHLVCWVDDPEAVDIVPAAHMHRYGARFNLEGVNVNFVRWNGDRLEMRTYERGVEGETLSCGTGVTAAALSAMLRGRGIDGCNVHTRGGDLRVLAALQGPGFKDITLMGPVRKVFTGEVEI